MASRSVIKKAPRPHQKPKAQPAIPEGLQLSAEELETIRKIAFGVESLKIIAEQGHEIHIGNLETFIETINHQAWDLYWGLWNRGTMSNDAASKAAGGGVR